MAGFEPAASSSRCEVAVPTASAAACLTWEPLSVGVRWGPLQATGVVTHLVTRFRGAFCLSTWMRTTGALLVARHRPIVIRVLEIAQDGRGAGGLPYLTAVQIDRREARMASRCRVRSVATGKMA